MCFVPSLSAFFCVLLQNTPRRAAQILVSCGISICIHSAGADSLHAQNEMQAISYNLSNVLPTDLIKSSVQDNRGFVWAASDAGVVRFDGRHSTLHKNLPSPYVKGMLHTKQGEVLVLTDMGLVKIREDVDSVRFPVVVAGATVRTDSTLFYAKSMFETSNGDVWLGEPDAIVRLRGTSDARQMKHFPFAPRYAADSFTRTFSFLEEANGTIIVASQRGHGLFRFDAALEKFVEIPVQGVPFASVSAILMKNPATRTIWVATNTGVYETSLNAPDAARSWKQVFSLRDVSCFAQDKAGNIYIGTWYLGVYCFYAATQTLTPLSYIDSKTINDIRFSADGNVWISGDDGITLLHPYTFFKPALPFDRPFIQQTILTQNGDILVCDGAAILRINPYLPGNPSKEILRISDRDWGSIIALTERTDGSIWCGTSGGYVIEIKDAVWRVVRQQPSENYFFVMFSDSKGTVWASRNPDARLTAIQPDGMLRLYDSTLGISDGIFIIREHLKSKEQSTVYAGGRGAMSYLYRFSNSTEKFENISSSLPFKVQEPFIVNDLFVESDTSLWLATTYGMVYFHNNVADTIPLSGEVARRNTLAVGVAPQGGLIFATDHGVYMYVRGEIVAVDLRLDKMVMSPSYRSMVIDKSSQLWLGTRSGLLLSKEFAKLVPETKAPMIVALRANGVPLTNAVRTSAKQEYISGLYLQAEFTALCFPAEKVRYQTRLVQVSNSGEFLSRDTAWHEARYTAEEIFPSISSGEYLLQIRAQQEGYLWSIPTSYRFTVKPAWYARWWAILLYVVGVGGLMYGAARLWAWRLERRNRVLKRIVEERTQEIQRQVFILDEQAREIELANTRLQEQNVQLIELNREKNDFLGIAAHDLKNPLTGIMMTVSTMRNYYDRMTKEDVVNQLQRVEQTSKRMHGIITELLDVNAIESGNFPLHLTDFDITPIVQEVVEDFRERAKAKDILLHLDIQANVKTIHADSTAVVQVIENIVSNAVKYSPNGKNVFVSLADNGSHTVRVLVRDEGPGLSKEDKDRLFEKFAKLSARPTAGESSTGLGLSIVKRMMESMHGRVLCESELGAGATFILEFSTSLGQ